MRMPPHVEGSFKLDGNSLPEDTHVVILAVPDEATLLRVAERLGKRGLFYKLIREPDSPWNNEATALGVAPTYARREVRRALSNIPLL